MKKFLFYLVQWTWGIVQNVLGLFLFLCLCYRKKRVFHGAVVTTWKQGALAGYILVFIAVLIPLAALLLKTPHKILTKYGYLVSKLQLLLNQSILFISGCLSILSCDQVLLPLGQTSIQLVQLRNQRGAISTISSIFSPNNNVYFF